MPRSGGHGRAPSAGLKGSGSRTKAQARRSAVENTPEVPEAGSSIGFTSGGGGQIIFNAVTVPVTGALLSADLRGLGPIPSTVVGVFVSFLINAQGSTRYIMLDASGSPDGAAGSPRIPGISGNGAGGMSMSLVGADGKVQLSTDEASTIVGVSAWVVGWWT